MQVTISTLLSLITVRDDALQLAAHQVLGDKLYAPDYALTQADADAIADEIGRMQDKNTIASHADAHLLGMTAADSQWQESQRLVVATRNAMKLVAICNLHTPRAWREE